MPRMTFGQAAQIANQHLAEVARPSIADASALAGSLRKYINNQDALSPKELVVIAQALLNRARLLSTASEGARIDIRIKDTVERLDRIQQDI